MAQHDDQPASLAPVTSGRVTSEQPTSEQVVDLVTSRRWHLVGVGGPGMAPLAVLLQAAGQTVTGSDLRPSPTLVRLTERGIMVRVGHDPAAVEGCDVVVHSTAVPADNPELVAARAAGIRVCHRSVALASLCAATRAVGVAGAHGKTTTAALLALMLRTAGEGVADYIGATVLDPRVGEGPASAAFVPDVREPGSTLVIEADESDGTIDALPLAAIAVTNVDIDHLDHWGDFDGLVDGFARIVGRVGVAGGTVVLNADDPSSVRIDPGGRTVRRFGWSARADVRIESCADTDDGIDVVMSVGRSSVRCALPLRGAHNAMNLACAVAMATASGVDPADACRAVETFGGVERRFTEMGRRSGALIIDDYAHLPAEIEATLAAAAAHPDRRGSLVAVFQPNRFHRIAAMADEYGPVFGRADAVIITDIYASGTAPIPGVTGKLVADAVARSHRNVVWAPSRADVVREVSALLAPGAVCVAMGCGDIATLWDDLNAGGA